ncbi:MAG TPA: hypothetical protein DCF73_03995 [Rhodobiaceae bacterium]|nr:hypothetical protein [Rhodobiaceae bacterium]
MTREIDVFFEGEDEPVGRLSGDEQGALLKGFAQTERKIWDALGNLGAAGGIDRESRAIANELAADLTAAFLWLGIEKKSLLNGQGN